MVFSVRLFTTKYVLSLISNLICRPLYNNTNYNIPFIQLNMSSLPCPHSYVLTNPTCHVRIRMSNFSVHIFFKFLLPPSLNKDFGFSSIGQLCWASIIMVCLTEVQEAASIGYYKNWIAGIINTDGFIHPLVINLVHSLIHPFPHTFIHSVVLYIGQMNSWIIWQCIVARYHRDLKLQKTRKMNEPKLTVSTSDDAASRNGPSQSSCCS